MWGGGFNEGDMQVHRVHSYNLNLRTGVGCNELYIQQMHREYRLSCQCGAFQCAAYQQRIRFAVAIVAECDRKDYPTRKLSSTIVFIWKCNVPFFLGGGVMGQQRPQKQWLTHMCTKQTMQQLQHMYYHFVLSTSTKQPLASELDVQNRPFPSHICYVSFPYEHNNVQDHSKAGVDLRNLHCWWKLVED